MRKTRPSTEDRIAWLWNTLNLTIETFDGVTEDEFKRDWGLWMKAHGCLIAVGQDLHRNLNVVDKELESYYRKLRNDLGHDYMLTPPDVLWEGIQKLPEMRASLEHHVPRDTLEDYVRRQQPPFERPWSSDTRSLADSGLKGRGR